MNRLNRTCACNSDCARVFNYRNFRPRRKGVQEKVKKRKKKAKAKAIEKNTSKKEQKGQEKHQSARRLQIRDGPRTGMVFGGWAFEKMKGQKTEGVLNVSCRALLCGAALAWSRAMLDGTAAATQLGMSEGTMNTRQNRWLWRTISRTQVVGQRGAEEGYRAGNGRRHWEGEREDTSGRKS